MAKRTPTAAPDDDLELGANLPGDDEDDIWNSSPIDPDPEDDERNDPVSLIIEKPIAEILSPIALQGVSPKMKKKPLSAMSSEWLQNTFARLSGLEAKNPDALEAPDWRMDVSLLNAAASTRELVLDVAAAPPAPVTTELSGQVHTPTGTAVAAVIVQVPLEDITPDPAQARDEGADDELADSIKANGFYTSKAIELRINPGAAARSEAPYMIVDGERRFRGARKAGLETIPATITSEAESEGRRLLRQVVSNDGKRLKPMEEARTFKRIMAAEGWNIQQLAKHLGKSKSTVSDRLALLDVPAELVKYFEEGLLSAAAAPILRPIAGLPERARKRVVENLLENGDFRYHVNDARDAGKSVPLDRLGFEIAGALHDELREIDPKLGGEYKGKTVALGKTSYAVDVPAYEAAVKKAEAALPKKTASTAPAQTSKPIKEKPSEYQLAERKRAADARKKAALRRAHFSALAAKLPTSLDGKWALFVVEHLLIEMHNDSRRAVYQALVEPGPVKANVNIMKELKTFAADQDAGGRVRMIVQLLLGSDLVIGSYDSRGAARIAAAAELAKFDLKKVKLDEPEFPASAKAKKVAHSLHAKKKARG